MPTTQKPIQNVSRNVIVTSNNIDLETRLLSAAIRIADATEQMAQNYTKLQHDLDYYKAGYERRGREIAQLKLSQRALKGAATKARKK